MQTGRLSPRICFLLRRRSASAGVSPTPKPQALWLQACPRRCRPRPCCCCQHPAAAVPALPGSRPAGAVPGLPPTRPPALRLPLLHALNLLDVLGPSAGDVAGMLEQVRRCIPAHSSSADKPVLGTGLLCGWLLLSAAWPSSGRCWGLCGAGRHASCGTREGRPC